MKHKMLFLFILKAEKISRINNPLCYPLLMERQCLREYELLNSYDLILKYLRFDMLFGEFARWTRALVITITIFKDVRNFSLSLSLSPYLFLPRALIIVIVCSSLQQNQYSTSIASFVKERKYWHGYSAPMKLYE